MPDGDISSRMDAVERLIELFRLERMVHLTVTSISLVLILGSAVRVIWFNEADLVSLGGFFESSGLVGYSSARLLRMWNDALEVLVDEDTQSDV